METKGQLVRLLGEPLFLEDFAANTSRSPSSPTAARARVTGIIRVGSFDRTLDGVDTIERISQ